MPVEFGRMYPPVPKDLPPERRATGTLLPRYEDIAQDGRVILTALPHAFGHIVWSELLGTHPIVRLSRTDGILPILTKLVLESGEGPVPVARPFTGRGAFDLAHTRDDRGEVDRLLLNVWVDLEGRRGRTHGPPPPGAGETIPVGRVFGEHVFTRPFAPAGARKVTRFPGGEIDEVPPREQAWARPASLLALPDGAAWVDEELEDDTATTVLGLAHTDSNQHVNSLVYPRLFEEAALRRFRARGESPQVLASRAEIAYRKPCFAGDELRVTLRAYAAGDRLGAVGYFAPAAKASDDPPRPHVYVRMTFSG